LVLFENVFVVEVLGPVHCKLHTKSSTVFLREAVYNNKVPPLIASYVNRKKKKFFFFPFCFVARLMFAMSLLLMCALWSLQSPQLAASSCPATRKLFPQANLEKSRKENCHSKSLIVF
jgi:hypothetical protein